MKATFPSTVTKADRLQLKQGGIEVHEEELSTITAQKLYQMRCECGRSWFELELKMLVRCPACARLNRVSIA